MKYNIVEKGNRNLYIRPNTLDDYVVKEVYGKEYDCLNLTKNDKVMDIGANIGAFAVRYAEMVECIFSYEPDKENFDLLNENIELNVIDNIHCFNLALVGNNDEVRDFFINTDKNKGKHSLFPKRGRDKIQVKCSNINEHIEFCEANKIKMDVEGAELELITSIIHWSKIDAIVLEFHHNLLTLDEHKIVVDILKQNFNEVIYRLPNNPLTTIIYATKEKRL